MIETVQMSKRHTHTHTHTHTRTHTHTHTPRNKTVERVSLDENDTLVFSKKSPPFLWEKSDPRYFSRILRRGGGGSIMVAGLKCLKLMQFQRNFYYPIK